MAHVGKSDEPAGEPIFVGAALVGEGRQHLVGSVDVSVVEKMLAEHYGGFGPLRLLGFDASLRKVSTASFASPLLRRE